MDMARLDTLEAHVVNLVEAFARVTEENKKLCRSVKQLQDVLDTQQEELARLRLGQEELNHLRSVMQTMQQERHAIRKKLEQMLVSIEWLEDHSRVDESTRA